MDYFLDYSFLLVTFELRIHWQRQYFRRCLFCHRKTSFFVPQRRIRPLEVERCRVMDLGRDVSLGEMRLKLITILNADHIEVIDSLGSVRFERQNNPAGLRSKQFPVPARVCAALLVPPW